MSANTAFSACEVSDHETAHGTLKISHVNPGPDAASDSNAAAISIDLQAGQIFALLPDGSLLLRPLAAPPAGTKAGLKLCNVGGKLGVVDTGGKFTPLT